MVAGATISLLVMAGVEAGAADEDAGGALALADGMVMVTLADRQYDWANCRVAISFERAR